MTTDAVGGVWNYSLSLAAALAGRGVKVRLGVIGPAPSVDRLAAVKAAGVGWVSVEAELDWLAGGAEALAGGRAAIRRAGADWGADLFQINQPAYAGGDYPTPVVTVAHSCVLTWWFGTHGRRPPAEWDWHGQAVCDGLRSAAIAIAPSRSFAAMLQRAYGLANPPLAVLNGIAARSGVAVAPKEKVVLASGRIWDESKNFAVLDAAAPLTDWQVQIAGDHGGAELGQEAGSAHYLGRLPAVEMARHYARASIYVSPSLHEPFGLGVLEAAQHGCALVLSDIASFRELWGGAAAFFYPKDPASLAAAVNQLIHDPAHRRELSRAAANRASRYSIEATAERMRGIHARAVQPAEVPA